jgi:two-component system, cell cycle sensor histidine kinase PleC
MSSFGCSVSLATPQAVLDSTAGSLAEAMPAFALSASCAEVYEKFHESGTQQAAALVDGEGRVHGLVNRLRFLSRYAQRFIPELYARRPVIELANRQPLIVDEAMNVSELGSLITFDHPDALRECFVVTRQGRYLGIGTGEALVRAKVTLLIARETQLNEALVAAEDADRTRANFLALMSHELRTPLNAIIGFSEVLAGELFGPHQVARYGEYARDINGAGKHLLALINDILDLSKSEAGHLELYPEPVEVKTLLQSCVQLLSGRAGQGQVEVGVAAADGLPLLEADALRLKQAVLNILSNAVKFTLPGGKVTVSAAVDGEGAMLLKVADTGIGMEPEQIPIALEPFRQINSPLSRNVEGTGLGLSLAKSLIERHGGSIAIESAPGKGTTVTLAFPPERTLHEAAAKSA